MERLLPGAPGGAGRAQGRAAGPHPRLKDIPLLAAHFLQVFARQGGRKAVTLSREATDRLVSYAWPGNVLELENVMQRAAIVASEDTIIAADLIFVAAPEKEVHKLNLLRNEKLRDVPAQAEAAHGAHLGQHRLRRAGRPSSRSTARPGRPATPWRRPATNPGMLVTWLVWFPFLPIGTVLVGRVWCGICPIAGIGDLVARLKRFNLPVPKLFKRPGVLGPGRWPSCWSTTWRTSSRSTTAPWPRGSSCW